MTDLKWTSWAKRFGDPCPFCRNELNIRDGRSLACSKGHRVVDIDGAPVDGVQWLSPKERDHGKAS